MKPEEFSRNAMIPGEAVQDLVRMAGHDPRNVAEVRINHETVEVVYSHVIKWPSGETKP